MVLRMALKPAAHHEARVKASLPSNWCSRQGKVTVVLVQSTAVLWHLGGIPSSAATVPQEVVAATPSLSKLRQEKQKHHVRHASDY